MIRQIVITIGGLLLMLAWWSFKSWWGGGTGGAQEGIPQKVWDGGGHMITYDVKGSGKMRVAAWFSGRDAKDGSESRSLETWQKLEAGSSSFMINVPKNSGATFDATVEDAKVGDEVSITIKADGRELCADTQKLLEPLKPGWALGAQCEIHDFAQDPAAPEESPAE